MWCHVNVIFLGTSIPVTVTGMERFFSTSRMKAVGEKHPVGTLHLAYEH